MSEQQAPPPEDTPTPDTQAPDQQTQEVNWQERYENLHPEYTRATQELSKFQNDQEFRAQLFRDLAQEQGYQLQEEEPEQFEDPTQQLWAELEQIKQQLSGQQQQSQQAEQIAFLEQNTEERLSKIDGLEEGDKDWLVSRAVSLPPLPDGTLDIQRAYQEMQQWEQSRQRRWAQTKRAPHFPASGQAGTGTPNKQDMNLDQITDWAVQEYAARTQE